MPKSRAIQINPSGRRNVQRLAHSYPAQNVRLPPRPPAQRPSEPAQQPPSLLLPASPPVFDPLEGTLKIDKAPTRCLSSYSSAFSCPSFKGRYIPSTSSASSSLKSKTSQYLDEEIKSASLSPTIFSFLREQGGSSSASVSTEGRTEYTQRHVGVCDDIAEQLQFDMQMDTLQDEDESKASQIPPG
mmetsp:Transcript_28048/g.45156  ORF Transcript_28048/g.45156 Transcript_28048/m.45156 type:complete len:186 (-) Transcript_28048:216-773(-)